MKKKQNRQSVRRPPAPELFLPRKPLLWPHDPVVDPHIIAHAAEVGSWQRHCSAAYNEALIRRCQLWVAVPDHLLLIHVQGAGYPVPHESNTVPLPVGYDHAGEKGTDGETISSNDVWTPISHLHDAPAIHPVPQTEILQTDFRFHSNTGSNKRRFHPPSIHQYKLIRGRVKPVAFMFYHFFPTHLLKATGIIMCL